VTETLRTLEMTIAARAGANPAHSYVAKLLHDGIPRIAKKLGEEATETVIAALDGDGAALTAEAADLIFHLLVLLHARGIPLADVEAEVARRDGISGLAEKAARTA
jgi:phosphoribosyl-ATP pyrophosphohydrolase